MVIIAFYTRSCLLNAIKQTSAVIAFECYDVIFAAHSNAYVICKRSLHIFSECVYVTFLQWFIQFLYLLCWERVRLMLILRKASLHTTRLHEVPIWSSSEHPIKGIHYGPFYTNLSDYIQLKQIWSSNPNCPISLYIWPAAVALMRLVGYQQDDLG